MNRDLLKYAGYGVLIVLIGIGIVLFVTRGAHVVLDGSVQMVRVQAVDDKACVVAIDFRFVNSSDYPFVVRDVELFMEDADGARITGRVAGEVDAKRLFEYYKVLGPKYNESLKARDRVESRESLDRMLAGRFELPESTVEARRRLIIRVEDVDGAVSEIFEDRGGS